MLGETEDEQTKEYLKEKLAQAKFVKKCIAERSSTIVRIMDLVAELQSDFFENGPGHKNPCAFRISQTGSVYTPQP